ncbi:MAG: glycosyltransferase family 2 protein [Defluviitaleaceae bacterium]|nr:glycosyltransferase family 2 protein [Defluviitaleaceae bacterium]
MIDDKIGIVLVNYNGATILNDCVRTIVKSTYTNYEIIVVDNDSKDNSIAMLEEEFPVVTVIKESENHGFAKGCNIGIKHALLNGAEYVMFLNNDTEIDEGMMEELLKHANENTVTVPKMYYYEPKNLVWYAGGKMLWKRGIIEHIGHKLPDNGDFDKINLVDFATGCCMLIHKEIFAKTGLFDEAYFMYFEDVDFSVRLIKEGFNILYIPLAKLWHKVSSSSGGEDSKFFVYYCNRNRLYFLKKNKGLYKFLAVPFVYTRILIKMTMGIIKNNNDKYMYLSLKAFLLGCMGRSEDIIA